jgi:TupA-like ATPgrasp
MATATVLQSLRRRVRDYLPDRLVIARNFAQRFGRRLDWNRPETFNEKLCWLMLHHRTPFVSRCTDKYAVRDIVSARVGSRYLNECYGVWTRPDQIPFEQLPTAFVLKVTGGWAMNVICPDKAGLDRQEVRSKLTGWMTQNHYRAWREWQYKDIPPRVLAERYLGANVPDYKFLCFNGEPLLIQVDVDRYVHHTRAFFDPEWNLLPLAYSRPRCERPPARPPQLGEMLEVARGLARNVPFVRVDLYVVDGRVIFGEMTWSPEAGRGRFEPESYDRLLGSYLELPRLAG